MAFAVAEDIEAELLDHIERSSPPAADAWTSIDYAIVQTVTTLAASSAPFGDAVDLEAHVRAAYARITPLRRLDFRYAGEPEDTFYLTDLQGPRPSARALLAGL